MDPTRPALLAPTSTLTVRGTSTLHDWQLTAQHLSGSACVPFPLDAGARLTDLHLTVPLDALEASGGRPMRAKLREVLKAKHFPSVAVIMEASEPLETSTDGFRASGHAQLLLAGTTQPLALTAHLHTPAKGRVRLAGEHRLSLRSLGLEPPTAFFGQLKTGDTITVVYTLDFTT